MSSACMREVMGAADSQDLAAASSGREGRKAM